MAKPAVRSVLFEHGKNNASANDRLYQRLAWRLIEELVAGTYAIGDRLPAERELAIDYGASRPAVHEA